MKYFIWKRLFLILFVSILIWSTLESFYTYNHFKLTPNIIQSILSIFYSEDFIINNNDILLFILLLIWTVFIVKLIFWILPFIFHNQLSKSNVRNFEVPLDDNGTKISPLLLTGLTKNQIDQYSLFGEILYLSALKAIDITMVSKKPIAGKIINQNKIEMELITDENNFIKNQESLHDYQKTLIEVFRANHIYKTKKIDKMFLVHENFDFSIFANKLITELKNKAGKDGYLSYSMIGLGNSLVLIGFILIRFSTIVYGVISPIILILPAAILLLGGVFIPNLSLKANNALVKFYSFKTYLESQRHEFEFEISNVHEHDNLFLAYAMAFNLVPNIIPSFCTINGIYLSEIVNKINENFLVKEAYDIRD